MIKKLLNLISESSEEDTKVGCFIETQNRIVIGYNERFSKTKESIIHAEEMAILELKDDEEGILYCSLSPCIHCASMIIQSGKITKVMYVKEYTKQDGLKVLEEHSIDYEQL